MSKVKLRIGGVPEHFNEPWHRAIESGAFKAKNIEVEWQSFPGGTGQMTRALREDTCDVCILLTEGIVTDIINGNPSHIISGYVKSPLIWGIHSAPDQGVRPDTVYLKEQFAISRPGSGSHLMPIVHGLLERNKPEESQFTIVNDLGGAIESLNAGDTQVFYWEKYTTKPYVQKGDLIRIDEFITPWPCFVIAATDKIINNNPEALDTMLKVIHFSCREFMELENASQIIADKYELDPSDASHWFHVTEWTVDSWVSNKMLKNVLYMLQEAKIVEGHHDTAELIWQRNRAE